MADKNIWQKIAEVKKSVEYLQKKNQGHQYKYVSSSQAVSAIREKVDELGLLLMPEVTRTEIHIDGKQILTEIWLNYTWVNIDKPDETITRPWYAQGIDNAGEKGVGKGYTYAEKYFILKFFQIPTDEDDPDSFQEKNGSNVTQMPSAKKASDQEIKQLAAACKKAGMNQEATHEFMDTTIGHHDHTVFTKEDVHQLFDALPTYKEAMAQ